MANSPQARKRARQAEKSRLENQGVRSKLRTFIKNVKKAIASGNKADAEQAYKLAVPVIDGSVNKGLIHKNKAARHKSRLNSQVRAL